VTAAKEYSRCIDCHRKLKNPRFRKIGRGDTCLKRHEAKAKGREHQLELKIDQGAFLI
jgi:hypothetical protein